MAFSAPSFGFLLHARAVPTLNRPRTMTPRYVGSIRSALHCDAVGRVISLPQRVSSFEKPARLPAPDAVRESGHPSAHQMRSHPACQLSM
jgi:hypothetical protein